jgi:hypothetical protein
MCKYQDKYDVPLNFPEMDNEMIEKIAHLIHIQFKEWCVSYIRRLIEDDLICLKREDQGKSPSDLADDFYSKIVLNRHLKNYGPRPTRTFSDSIIEEIHLTQNEGKRFRKALEDYLKK